ncbi:MAG: hypothetical protein M1840_000421 [Geoglossum simile]|nr:MAG: hypothetical protein M1840_000421 [Geoglossum simile]
MATATKIHLTPSEAGMFHVPGITAESAAKASEVLQENHEKNHIFYNDEGFHNHIVHHILTIYALGASPETIQTQYDDNKIYQRPHGPIHRNIVDELGDYEKRKKYLGKEQYSSDFQVFFQKEIERLGWEEALQEYAFKGDEGADDMLVRLYMGFLHPIIHLGFGIEFKQPAVIAQALAQAAVHENWLGPFFYGAEKAAKPSTKTLVDLLHEIRADKKLSMAADWGDGNKIRDGIMKRALEEMIGFASQWSAEPGKLEDETAEMISAVGWYTAAAQHPPKQIKLDFYYLHCFNSSIFFPLFHSLPSIPVQTKARLLTWKVRLDLAMYASRRSPELLWKEVEGYMVPNGGWEAVFRRAVECKDDGHVAKAARAAWAAEGFCKGRGGTIEWDKVGWTRVGSMAVDSVESPGPRWVRSAGFEKAWEQVRDRE